MRTQQVQPVNVTFTRPHAFGNSEAQDAFNREIQRRDMLQMVQFAVRHGHTLTICGKLYSAGAEVTAACFGPNANGPGLHALVAAGVIHQQPDEVIAAARRVDASRDARYVIAPRRSLTRPGGGTPWMEGERIDPEELPPGRHTRLIEVGVILDRQAPKAPNPKTATPVELAEQALRDAQLAVQRAKEAARG